MQEVQGCASLQLVHSIDDENIFLQSANGIGRKICNRIVILICLKNLVCSKTLFCAPAQAWSTESLSWKN